MPKAVREGRAFVPSVPHDDNFDPIELDPLYNNEAIQSFRGYSELQECMVRRVQNKGLERPVGNRLGVDSDEDC
jgi:hypothetical protein